ncbi:protein shisa-5 isoform X3 [Phascolarctos cinereus]
MAASPSSRRFFLLLPLLPSPLGAKGEGCGFLESCPAFCCGNCIFKFCCSDVLKKIDDNILCPGERSIKWEEKDKKMTFDFDHSPPPGGGEERRCRLPKGKIIGSASACSRDKDGFRDIRGHWSNHLCAHCGHHHPLFNVFLLLFVQDVPKAQTCGDNHVDYCGPLCIPTAARCATWLPWGHVPRLPTYACPAWDASCALSNAVPTTLPCPAYWTSCLPRDSVCRCWSAIPNQPTSIQPCIHGASKDCLLSCF